MPLFFPLKKERLKFCLCSIEAYWYQDKKDEHGRKRTGKSGLIYSHLSMRLIWWIRSTIWIKQASNRFQTPTRLNRRSSATASSCNLFHQVFCWLHADIVLISWALWIWGLGSICVLEIFQDACAPFRKLLHRCLICNNLGMCTITTCLSNYS